MKKLSPVSSDLIKALLISFLTLMLCSCSNVRRLRSIEREGSSVMLELNGSDGMTLPRNVAGVAEAPETLLVTDSEGRSYNLMRTQLDENGELVASDRINASYISARFRNVAERCGMIELQFDINVPPSMLDSRWQLRLYPRMRLLSDTLALEPVYLTGMLYRKKQLRGYQQYERFVESIVSDSSAFVRRHQLETFINRNIPAVASFRNDSSYVSDEQFCSAFGVSVPEAINHYTRHILKSINAYRASLDEKMRQRYVKAPIVSEGLRLDSVITDCSNTVIYHYVQSVGTRPGLRKIDVELRSELWRQDECLYCSPYSDALSFYVSSLSGFARAGDRYVSRKLERNLSEDAMFWLEFEQGVSEFDDSRESNSAQLEQIRNLLRALYKDEKLSLDSVTVYASASPEGNSRHNLALSQRRSDYTCRYFNSFIKGLRDSVLLERGYAGDLSSGRLSLRDDGLPELVFEGKGSGENWRLLDRLMQNDSLIGTADKLSYMELRSIADEDAREAELKTLEAYPYVSERLYPLLRNVRFDFHLHRRGIQKDTLVTVVDSTYSRGVELLLSRDYKAALEYLAPYSDYNAAVAYLALDRNLSARTILELCPVNARVNYLLAIVYARLGDTLKAVEAYLSACREDPSFVHRGNLDPEISALKKLYDLRFDSDE